MSHPARGAGSARSWLGALQRFGVRPGLERVRTLLAALDHPERGFEVVLVAGTNGKGSVTALLHAMLTASGRHAGRFVSPHLERLEERVVVGAAEIEGELLDEVLERVRPIAEGLGATYFEVLTAAALEAFARTGVEVAVLEVGMGGRWDATNATDPVLSVITTVDLDHTEVLGDTLEAVAGEKAGVARGGRPLVTGVSGDGADTVLRHAEAVGARAWSLVDARARVTGLGWRGTRVELTVPTGERWRLETPLAGPHQGRNLALAAAAASLLGVPEAAARQGAVAVRWPGRLELVRAHGRRWILDGAHNPAGARALAAALRQLEPAGLGALIVGVSDDKDLEGVLAPLAGLGAVTILTAAGTSRRATPPDALAEAWRRVARDGTSPLEAPETGAAIEAALAAVGAGGGVVVAGSLFLVGEARALLRGSRPVEGPRWQ